MKETLLSPTLVAVTTFNAEKNLGETLESCIKQSVLTEVWIIDNLSSDNTIAIANDYASKYQNVKVFVNERNLGRVGNWNRAIDLFVDSDFDYLKIIFPGDLIDCNCIEVLDSIFLSDPNVGSIGFSYRVQEPGGDVWVSKNSLARGYVDPKETTKLNLVKGGF